MFSLTNINHRLVPVERKVRRRCKLREIESILTVDFQLFKNQYVPCRSEHREGTLILSGLVNYSYEEFICKLEKMSSKVWFYFHYSNNRVFLNFTHLGFVLAKYKPIQSCIGYLTLKDRCDEILKIFRLSYQQIRIHDSSIKLKCDSKLRNSIPQEFVMKNSRYLIIPFEKLGNLCKCIQTPFHSIIRKGYFSMYCFNQYFLKLIPSKHNFRHTVTYDYASFHSREDLEELEQYFNFNVTKINKQIVVIENMLVPTKIVCTNNRGNVYIVPHQYTINFCSQAHSIFECLRDFISIDLANLTVSFI